MAAFVWSFHRKGFTICCSFTDSYTATHTQVAAGYRARRWARLTIANYLGFINLSKEERSSWVIVAPKMTFHSMNINMKSCSYSWQTTENHNPSCKGTPKPFPRSYLNIISLCLCPFEIWHHELKTAEWPGDVVQVPLASDKETLLQKRKPTTSILPSEVVNFLTCAS